MSDPLGRDDVLELLDTFILKLFIEIGLEENGVNRIQEYTGRSYFELIEEMFDSNNRLLLNFGECENYLKSIGDKGLNVLAMLYESFNRKTEALNI